MKLPSMSPVIEDASALIRIPSVNPQYDPSSQGEIAAVEWIEAWARGHGMEARLDEVLPGRPNVVLTLRNGAARPHFLMAGHMDTVGVDGMKNPPFDAVIANGRLTGRGSADMKGPLAAMLHALLALRDCREYWRGTVSLACVVDEEYQARGIKALMARGDSDYDFAVVGEPTGLAVVRGCKGCLRFSFEAVGVAAHSSQPELGRNAIVAMSEAVIALDSYFRSRLAQLQCPGFGCSTGSVGLVQGGSGINIVPDACRASVDVRLVPGQRWEETYREAVTSIEGSTSLVRGVHWRFDPNPFTDPAFETAENHPLVGAALALRGQATARVAAFSCDASKIAAAGVPCIILGPGDISEAHSSTESIGVDEIDAAVECYARLVQQMLPVA